MRIYSNNPDWLKIRSGCCFLIYSAGRGLRTNIVRSVCSNKGIMNINAVRKMCLTLRKHAYSNISKILQPKNEIFQIRNSDIFHISAQNIDCGYSLEPPRGGGSNEYPQSMFF